MNESLSLRQQKYIIMNLDPVRMLAPRLQSMEESATIRMAQKARDLASKGVNVISLTLGEPDFDTPEFIKKQLTMRFKEERQNIHRFQEH